MLLITIALLIVFSLTLNGFATVGNLLNLLRSISILGILGLGMGMIVISRGIDLSEVAIMAGSWCVALIEMQNGMPIVLGVRSWRLRWRWRSAPSTASWSPLSRRRRCLSRLAAGFVIYGAAFWFAPAWVVYAPKDAPGLLFLGAGTLFGIPMPIFVFAVSRPRHALPSVADLDRPLHLCPGRQSGSGAAFRASRCAR